MNLIHLNKHKTSHQANRPRKRRRKPHRNNTARSSCSDALIVEHQTLTDVIQTDTSNGESNGMINAGATTTELMMMHRKTSSLLYIHLHSMLNRLDGENRTALSHACEKGQREVIEFLLSKPGIVIEA
eukprot:586065_1